MRKGTLLRTTIVTAVLTPLAVTSIPPETSWELYHVGGFVVRDSGSPANHTVVMLGRCDGTTWRRIGTCSFGSSDDYGPFTTIALTSDSGEFLLRTSDCTYCDSLAVGVVYPDTMIVSTAFAVYSVTPTQVEKQRSTTEDGFLCDDTTESTYIDGYIFQYPDVTVPVP